MLNLRYRLIIIVASSSPRYGRCGRAAVVRRRETADGVIQYDTTRRMPIREGLDLKGGMHLTLEVDESKGVVANKSDAIDRALKVVRTRIDQFGVSEPVVQKAGTDRMVVELPGVQDQQRAYDIVKEAAFLQMQIVDKTQALDKALPHLDAILKAQAVHGRAAATPTGQAPSANAGVQSLFSNAPTDTTGKGTDTAKARRARGTTAARGAPRSADSARDTTARLGQAGSAARWRWRAGDRSRGSSSPGSMPGEFYVAQGRCAHGHALPVAAGGTGAPCHRARSSGGRTTRPRSASASYRAFYVLDARPDHHRRIPRRRQPAAPIRSKGPWSTSV